MVGSLCLSVCVALLRSCAFFICDIVSDNDAHLVGGECPERSAKPLMSCEVHFNIHDHFFLRKRLGAREVH